MLGVGGSAPPAPTWEHLYNCCKLLKTKEDHEGIQEATFSLSAAKEISADAAGVVKKSKERNRMLLLSTPDYSEHEFS